MLSRLTSSLGSLLRRPATDWCLLVEAIAVLVWSKIRLQTIPFAVLTSDLGVQQADTFRQISATDRKQSSKISWAVQTAAHYVPLRLVCLPQAMAASFMLGRRGISSTLYLGVKIDQANAFTAHAWLRSGLKWVTGGAARHGHSVVAQFATTAPTSVSAIDKLRLTIFLSVLATIAVLTLLPTPPLFDLNWSRHSDQMRHLAHTIGSHDSWFNFVGFTLAGLIYNFALYGPARASLRYRWFGASMFAGSISLLESIQLFMPSRNFDFYDISMGLAATLAASPFWIRIAARS